MHRHRYRLIVLLFPFALAAYALVSVGSLTFLRAPLKGSELFPFFNWSLFSMPKRLVTRYTLVLTNFENGGTGAPGDGKANKNVQDTIIQREILFSKVMWQFGNAYERRDEDSLQLERTRALAENFLKAHGVRTYDLVKLKLNPIDYYTHRKTVEEQTLASFTVGEN